MKTRITTAMGNSEEELTEKTLRPVDLSHYIGQEKLKSTLSIYMEAARNRKESLDHVLLYGPPGLGKTTLALIIANEMKSRIRITSGPAIERPGDLAAILNSLNENDILFIDEIHRLNRQVEEVLYPAMEDYAIDVMTGKGASSQSVRFSLPHFTLIGATTRAGLLTAPLRDRFGIVHHMEFYTHEELKKILLQSAAILQVGLEDDAALEIARRSRGTPRIANRFLKRIRDFADIHGNGTITLNIAREALRVLEVDEEGLDGLDRSILQLLIETFHGRPVGVETIAASLSEDVDTIEDVYEPYLLQNGFLMRTPKGRVATEKSYRHLGIPYEES